jgi:ATP synthase protein I
MSSNGRPNLSAGESRVQQNWKGLAGFATLGLEFALSVLVGLFGGRWLDARLGTAPWLAIVGFGFGVAAGARAIYRAARAANLAAEREGNEERERRQRYHDDDPKQ